MGNLPWLASMTMKLAIVPAKAIAAAIVWAVLPSKAKKMVPTATNSTPMKRTSGERIGLLLYVKGAMEWIVALLRCLGLVWKWVCDVPPPGLEPGFKV